MIRPSDDVGCIYLYRHPVDMRNYVEFIVMRSHGGKRLREQHFCTNLRRIIIRIRSALHHCQEFLGIAKSINNQ